MSIFLSLQNLIQVIEIKNYIGGNWHHKGLDTIPLMNPATGKKIGTVVSSCKEHVDLAYMHAKKAFPIWSALSNDKRSKYLVNIANRIEERLEELAIAESLDNGKPLALAKKVDIPRAAANFRFFGHAITQFASQSHSMGESGINYTLRQPLGVVGCISPWNLPLYLFSWKIAPALAAGNVVVAKPSEITPYTAYILADICMEIGLPEGVLNIVNGYGDKVGDAITRHPGIKAISFTGSTKVGGLIAGIAAPLFKKISLEMGGKNANVIFEDCDYDKMLSTTIHSSFANQGQICLCGSRIYVHEHIYEKFKSDFVKATRKLKVGDPNHPNTKIGAIVSEAHYHKILNYIDIAKEEGGVLLSGGNTVHPEGLEKGWYISPTIIENVDTKCRINQEEVFGPVVTLQSFKGDDDVLNHANDSKYGLSATIWTNNLNRAHRFARELEVGIVWVNTWLLRDLRTPFGGFKNSGVGREGGFEALEFFTEPKNVCIHYT